MPSSRRQQEPARAKTCATQMPTSAQRRSAKRMQNYLDQLSKKSGIGRTASSAAAAEPATEQQASVEPDEREDCAMTDAVEPTGCERAQAAGESPAPGPNFGTEATAAEQGRVEATREPRRATSPRCAAREGARKAASPSSAERRTKRGAGEPPAAAGVEAAPQVSSVESTQPPCRATSPKSATRRPPKWPPGSPKAHQACRRCGGAEREYAAINRCYAPCYCATPRWYAQWVYPPGWSYAKQGDWEQDWEANQRADPPPTRPISRSASE